RNYKERADSHSICCVIFHIATIPSLFLHLKTNERFYSIDIRIEYLLLENKSMAIELLLLPFYVLARHSLRVGRILLLNYWIFSPNKTQVSTKQRDSAKGKKNIQK